MCVFQIDYLVTQLPFRIYPAKDVTISKINFYLGI